MSREKASYKWMILFIATLSQACATFVTYGAGPLAAFWQRLYDLSQFQTGLLVSAVQIGRFFLCCFLETGWINMAKGGL
ncbi:hypothetical protein M3611_18865 [Priestia megaterium]|nr:hypothetical protein [Priestia megaterium]MCM3154067.1 hypothetical protein [Priestia megaterium]